MLGASGHTGAAGGEPEEAARPVCENVDPATDPNEWYRRLVVEQLELRDSTEPGLDASGDDVRAVLREHSDGFDGHLLFFASSDFGQPRVFLPEELSDRQACLQAVLDRVHERKWRARNSDLRDVRDQMFDEVRGIHRGLGALYHEEGSADYDIEFPWNRAYNFVTVRQAIGLIDWVTNAKEPWLDGLRLTY
jgi:hypothetical protein